MGRPRRCRRPGDRGPGPGRLPRQQPEPDELLQPLRVAGRGVPRRAGRRSATRSTTSPGSAGNDFFQDVAPDDRSERRDDRLRPPPVPAAAGGRADAVRGGAGAWRPTPSSSPPSSARSTSGSPCGCSAGCRSVSGSASRRPCSSASAPSLWYAAELGTTWYLAHVVAVGLTLLAIGVALSGDPGAAARSSHDPVARAASARPAPGSLLDRRQVLAGILFGLACTARLTVVFGRRSSCSSGGGGSRLRRGASARRRHGHPDRGPGRLHLATTGHLFNPGYDLLYHLETVFYPELGYHPTGRSRTRATSSRTCRCLLAGPADRSCRRARPAPSAACSTRPARSSLPRDVGMGLFLTSPACLLAFASLRWLGRDRLVTGAAVAVLLIAVVDLMHFSQGWVQFGYRFSNDFAPFGLLLAGPRPRGGWADAPARLRPDRARRWRSSRGAWSGATSSDGERPRRRSARHGARRWRRLGRAWPPLR